MASLDVSIKALKSSIFELGEGFKGMPDEQLWTRPHPRLLSVGELGVHVGYWLAQSFFGETFESPLMVAGGEYYTKNVSEPVTVQMTAEEMFSEIKRVFEAGSQWLLDNPKDSDDANPYREGWTWGYVLEYQAFHVAYHTGQIYSVRHLLGHETADN